MQVPNKRTLAIATVAILAIYLAGQAVPQLGKSLAFAASDNSNSGRTDQRIRENVAQFVKDLSNDFSQLRALILHQNTNTAAVRNTIKDEEHEINHHSQPVAATAMGMNNSASSSANKTFYLFTTEVGGVNETKLGISGDAYSLQTMVVNKGDEVTVHFYNLEKDAGEKHSFTIGAPYNINKVLAGGDNATITFKADHEGVFQYHCIFHPPQMIGQLVVLPHPTTS